MCSEQRCGLVVVVEDDDGIREILNVLLSAMGLVVVPCRNATEGIRAIRQFHPSAVTLDLNLPEMDGVEVLDLLARDESTSSVPVVIISTYASDRGLRSRAQVKEIVQKPFDVDLLCRKVRRAVEGDAA